MPDERVVEVVQEAEIDETIDIPLAQPLAVVGDQRDRGGLDRRQAAVDQPRGVAALGVIPVPQGRFISEIGDGMLAALGPERSTWCYRQRSFLEAGLSMPLIKEGKLRALATTSPRRLSVLADFPTIAER